MSQHLIAWLSPTGNERPRVGGDFPEIVFGSIESPAMARLSFGALDDPAGYLRDLASIALGLAEQFESMTAEASA